MRIKNNLEYDDNLEVVYSIDDCTKPFSFVETTKVIAESTFSSLTLEPFEINDGLEQILFKAFKSAKFKQNSLIFPESTQIVEDYAFDVSRGLKSVEFKNDNLILGVCAFYDSELEEIKLNGVKEIGELAFKHTNISDINLSDVEKIGEEAFDGIFFKKLYLPKTLKSVYFNSFDWFAIREIHYEGDKNDFLKIDGIKTTLEKYPSILEKTTFNSYRNVTLEELVDKHKSFKDINNLFLDRQRSER